MKRSRNVTRVYPKLSILEDRTLPAGNVLASMLGTSLFLTGDELNNNVIISRGASPGSIVAQGINTTLNGERARLTFDNVRELVVDTADGNDMILTNGLSVGSLTVLGGSGDDLIYLRNTSNSDAFFSMMVSGDESYSGSTRANGNDSITISGTQVEGEYADISINSDLGYDTHAGLDRVTIEHTRVNVNDFFLYYSSEYADAGPGNIVTITDFQANIETFHSFLFVRLEGSSGDDVFYIRDVNINVVVENDTMVDFLVDSPFGIDTVNVSNMHIHTTNLDTVDETADGWFFSLFNQSSAGFFAQNVNLDNFSLVGGGTFYAPLIDLYYLGGSFLYLSGNEIDAHNVSLHTNGWGGVTILSPEFWFDGVAQDESVSLSNFAVSSADGTRGELLIDMYGNDDSVQIRNTSCEYLGISLGSGDDSLVMTNVSGDIRREDWWAPGGIYADEGNDEVEITNCSFPDLLIDMGAGNDALTLRNNTIGVIDLIGGTGIDFLVRQNNTGLFNLYGFEII